MKAFVVVIFLAVFTFFIVHFGHDTIKSGYVRPIEDSIAMDSVSKLPKPVIVILVYGGKTIAPSTVFYIQDGNKHYFQVKHAPALSEWFRKYNSDDTIK